VPNFVAVGQTVMTAIFQFFHDGGRPPSWICDAHVWITHKGNLAIFYQCANLLGIDSVVSIICKF